MPKGALENASLETRAAQIRDRIRTLEIGVANLADHDLFDLLSLRTQVEREVQEQQDAGLDMRAERTRLETVDNILDRRSGEIVRRAARQGGLERARQRQRPPADHWWWYLDEAVAERQRSTAIRISAGVIGAIVLVLLANYLLNTFFGLDPIEREAYGHTTAAEQMLFRGDYAEAITRYEQALEVKPDLAEAWVALGVLYDLEGRSDESAEAFATAEDLIQDRVRFVLVLARNYEMVGALEEALTYAQEGVELAPQSAEAILIRGGIHDSRGERAEALVDFERASELAQENGEDALYVLARTRMGMLMQQGDSVPLPGTGGF